MFPIILILIVIFAYFGVSKRETTLPKRAESLIVRPPHKSTMELFGTAPLKSILRSGPSKNNGYFSKSVSFAPTRKEVKISKNGKATIKIAPV